MSSRAGHHGDVVYKFEDDGFDSAPNDTEFKIFGSNAVLDTAEGSNEAVRVFNSDRTAAEIIKQVFDGAWSVTCQLSEPPWWLSAIFGSPSSSETSTTDLYEHVYSISGGGDPQSLRLFTPTDGFSEYEVYAGAVVASVTVDQSQPNSPELTLTGAYAREPFRDDAETISIPAFAESTFNNRKAEVQVDGNTLGRAQNTSIDLQANTEIINEIGSGHGVDFVPRVFAPDPTYDHIRWTEQNVDLFQRFTDASGVSVTLAYDNGESGTDEYGVEFALSGSFPNAWSESGRNDPEADLIEELQDMAEDATVTITEDESEPPT